MSQERTLNAIEQSNQEMESFMGDEMKRSDGTEFDAELYAQVGSTTNRLREPVTRSAIQALQLPQGSHGLDAGGGTGLQAISLAKAVGSAGHVTILDLSAELLEYAKKNAKDAGLAERFSFKEGDVRALPFDDDSFDWAWSADCVGYGPLEPLPLVKELVRVVKPVGLIALLAWSSDHFLPGYPLLEARLNSTASGIAPFVKGKNPELHFLRALGWFYEAGLREIKARTFVGDAHAPLSEDFRNALAALLQMRWPDVEAELSPEYWAEYQRLCLPESPDFILDQPDYYAFYTYSMFSGIVAK
jgi:demethylmenaquinone methyltransferase/2-methoxy-6-polyprenyl-1,4-benzoquinol methylase